MPNAISRNEASGMSAAAANEPASAIPATLIARADRPPAVPMASLSGRTRASCQIRLTRNTL